MTLLTFLLYWVLPVYILGLIISWIETSLHELTCRPYESRTTRQRFVRIISWPTYLIRFFYGYSKEVAKGE